MQLIINGEAQELDVKTLEDVIHQLKFSHSIIATALNGQFISQTARKDTQLSEKDKVEILAPMQGG